MREKTDLICQAQRRKRGAKKAQQWRLQENRDIQETFPFLVRNHSSAIQYCHDKVADNSFDVVDSVAISEEITQAFLNFLLAVFHTLINGKIKTMKRGIKVSTKTIYNMEALASHQSIICFLLRYLWNLVIHCRKIRISGKGTNKILWKRLPLIQSSPINLMCSSLLLCSCSNILFGSEVALLLLWLRALCKDCSYPTRSLFRSSSTITVEAPLITTTENVVMEQGLQGTILPSQHFQLERSSWRARTIKFFSYIYFALVPQMSA